MKKNKKLTQRNFNKILRECFETSIEKVLQPPVRIRISGSIENLFKKQGEKTTGIKIFQVTEWMGIEIKLDPKLKPNQWYFDYAKNKLEKRKKKIKGSPAI